MSVVGFDFPITWHNYYYLLSPTPVDPAGPDCYQSGTKPCESTQQCVAYGSVTRSQHAQGTWITSGN